jgi:mannose-6-phosphate isomerase
MIKFEVKPYRLENSIQHYVWGSKNADAFIAHLLGIKAEKNKPYAELWIGAHPKAPSMVVDSRNKIPLNKFIDLHPNEILGVAASRKFNNKIPFLFKVLSAAEALSIQAHPNKAQAEELHRIDPLNYSDANHKPEIAISIDGLTALVGFRSYPEIIAVLKKYPELMQFIEAEGSNDLIRNKNQLLTEKKENLKKLVSALFSNASSKPDLLEQTLNRLEKRLRDSSDDLEEREELFLGLKQQYGNDVGLYTLFFLNLVHLQKGQGVFLESGIPHTYLKGNIIECMANSDNVVRAGLTPKFKDSETLVKILSFESGVVNILKCAKNVKVYDYPSLASEFSVSRIVLKKNDQLKQSCKSIQIILLLTGEARIEWKNGMIDCKQSDVFIIPAAMKHYSISASSNIEIFRAEIPSSFPV